MTKRQFLAAATFCSMLLLACPTLAQTDGGVADPSGGQSLMADVAQLFGHDPGDKKAYACFTRSYTREHLASHPDQNVRTMTVFVSKGEGEELQFNLGMQVKFRKVDKPFDISGGCSRDQVGKKSLQCGIECDGGFLDVRVKNKNSILVDIPQSVRIFEADEEVTSTMEERARFGLDDKLFRLDRTDLKNCLPVIYDEDIKAEISGRK